MTQKQKQQQAAVESVINLLRTRPFTFEFAVKKKPARLKVIYEVTQQQMDALIEQARFKK